MSVCSVYVRVLYGFICFLCPNNIVWNLNSTFALHLLRSRLLTKKTNKKISDDATTFANVPYLHGTMRIAYIKSAINNTVSCTINFFSARFQYIHVYHLYYSNCVYLSVVFSLFFLSCRIVEFKFISFVVLKCLVDFFALLCFFLLWTLDWL